jgi:putative drug exporter of the RND superfamily
MTSLLRSLAATTTRRPRISLAVLLLLLVGAIGVATSAGGEYVDDFAVPGIESQAGQDLIEQRFPGHGGDSATVVLSGSLRDAEPAIDAAMAQIEGQPHVTSVEDPLSPGHVAEDRRTAFATVSYDADADDLGAAPRERLEDATASLADAGVDVAMSGPVIDAGNEAKLPVGELAGVLVAMVLLLVVLRSARAAFASLLTALFGVALGFGLLGLAASGVDVPSLAPTMAAMLGIGAGIDYALLSASRHQEELRAGRDPAQAAIRTNATAGHAAVTAAAIVLVAISGLLVTGIPFVGKVGVAAGVMVLVTSLVAVLLLPPLFAAAGRKMLPRRERARSPEPAVEQPARDGFAVRRPRIALLAGALVAAVLCVPAASLTIGQPDDGNLATDQTQRHAYDRLAAAFGPGFNGPLVVTVDGADAPAAADRVRDAVAGVPGVASVAEPTLNEQRDAALLTVFPRSSPQAEETARLVEQLREETIPRAVEGTRTDALVGGYTARLVDEADRISARLPIFALAVVGLSLLLLAMTFRSIKVAALSAVFNLVSIAAAYGIVHLLFQTETGAKAIGVDVQPVVAYVPLFMFAILFGLSTDYNVFLLSRVREEWQRLGHVAPAVARASARTRRTISSAGAIMIVVFLGFTTDPDSTIKMAGFGLASAILVDITLVRLLLAPASLTLLGDRLWSTPARHVVAPAPAA